MAILRVFALDCPDPWALAEFYGALTGWPVDEGKSDDSWVQLDGGGGVTVAFQRVDPYRAPDWPGDAHPQQAHLDFEVQDLDVGEAEVVARGGRVAVFQPGQDFRVFVDPAGHPFCLVLP